MERIAYIGIDVHKDTNSCCLFYRDLKGSPSLYDMGTVPAGVDNMVKVINKTVRAFQRGLARYAKFATTLAELAQ